MNNELLKFQAKIIGFQAIFLGIVAIFFVIFSDNLYYYLMGLLFGGIIGALTFRMMGISLAKSLSMDPSAARINAGIGYVMRMIVYAAVLYVAVVADYLSILTTALGLVAIKIVIIGLNFLKIKF